MNIINIIKKAKFCIVAIIRRTVDISDNKASSLKSCLDCKTMPACMAGMKCKMKNLEYFKQIGMNLDNKKYYMK